MPKIIIRIAKLPPPHGGITTFNDQLYKFFRKSKIPFLFFSFGKKKAASHYINIHMRHPIGLLGTILHLGEFWRIIYRLRTKHIISIPFGKLFKRYHQARLISRYLRRETAYSALCHHLADEPLIFYIIKQLGFSVDIHTYLHGYGIIESYDRDPELHKKLTNLSNTFIVASRYMLDVYNRKKDQVKDVRICSPFLPDQFYAPYSYPKENIFLFIGQLEKRKNVNYLLDEWSRVAGAVGDYRLKIVGDGSLRKRLFQKIKKRNLTNVILIGEIPHDQIQAELAKTKFLVLPSIREPFGRVIVEAMAQKVVPIVSDRGGMKEIFSERAGYVFPIEDGALAKIIIEVTSNDRHAEKYEAAFRESQKYKESILGPKLLSILLE